MHRWVPALLLACATVCLPQSGSQDKQSSKKDQSPPAKEELKKERPKPPATKEAVPPEEDTGIATEEHGFNPLQAEKELQAGNFYFKKGSYIGAAGRYREATMWNDGYAEAWLRLGEAEEKLKDFKSARAAYTKYLEIAPDAKNAAEIRKKLGKLK